MVTEGKCPICDKLAAERFKPFCSRRCADLDLGSWLKGGYAIPGPQIGSVSPSNPSETDSEED